ncbi:MAG: twin-arginine translocase TatA/TatE family subunit [Solirubrobacterales bacterium]|nr:twin-arginine translocase TatA/TatE family subunit [Solirubrobacterales bacterium]
MPNIGPLELVVVLIIALVVFGPKRLPELGRSLGRGIREFRGSVTGEHRYEEDDDESPATPPAIESPKPPSEQTAKGETAEPDRDSASESPKPPSEQAAEGETAAHDRD